MSEYVPATLDAVRKEAHPAYPVTMLDDVETALVFFCAGFFGSSDVIHVNDAPKFRQGCGVDINGQRLDVMRVLYDNRWAFVRGDAFDTLGHATWDMVGLDPPIELSWAAASHDTWYRQARKLVVHGMLVEDSDTERFRVGGTPAPGWTVARVMDRNGYSVWVVSTR